MLGYSDESYDTISDKFNINIPFQIIFYNQVLKEQS